MTNNRLHNILHGLPLMWSPPLAKMGFTNVLGKVREEGGEGGGDDGVMMQGRRERADPDRARTLVGESGDSFWSASSIVHHSLFNSRDCTILLIDFHRSPMVTIPTYDFQLKFQICLAVPAFLSEIASLRTISYIDTTFVPHTTHNPQQFFA